MSKVVKVLKLGSRNDQEGNGKGHNRSRALVAGGAGFLGSHLCERLLQDGYDVVAVDNFHTGKRYNLNALLHDPRFSCIEHDIVDPLTLDLRFDE
ncbi:NAD-dependent epimerase/dehydratase family protein, partial [Mesorhizobium sp. M2D.F.Ca.ET.178.01.1.1]